MLVTFLVGAIFFKNICTHEVGFLCWMLGECEFWIERYQTLLTGVMAIFIGYANIKQMQDQMLHGAIENNRRIKLIVYEKTDSFFLRLSREISSAYAARLLATQKITVVEDVKLPLIVVEPEQYVALNARGRGDVVQIRNSMRECKARLISTIQQGSAINDVQAVLSEMHDTALDIAKNIPVNPYAKKEVSFSSDFP